MSKKKGKDRKKIKEEENVITKEEFKKLEEREAKKGGIFGLFRKKKEKKFLPAYTGEAEKKKTGSIEELILNIEKINGKLEIIDNFRGAIEERIVKLGEEIGELRSSILEQEGIIGRIESRFSRVEEATSEIEPEKIAKEREKNLKLIEENRARIDIIDKKIDSFSSELKSYRKFLEKIKSFENLLKMFKNIEGIASKVKDSENNARRFSSKIEKIFGEFETRMTEITKLGERVEKLDDLVNETVGSMDALELKMKNAVLKEDLEKFRKSMESELRNFKFASDDKIQELKALIDMIVSSMEEKKEKKETKPYQKKTESGKKAEQDEMFRIRNLIRKCSEFIQKGDTESARKAYLRIIDEYKKIQQSSKNKEELNELYEDIMRIYNEIEA